MVCSKKILVLTNTASTMKVFRTELIQSLLHEYDITLDMIRSDEHKAFFEGLGCTCLDAPLDRRGMSPIKDCLLFLHYLKTICSVKSDVVVTYTIKPNIYGGLACRMLNVPYIATVEGLGTAFTKTGLFRSFISFLYKSGLKSARSVFYLNDYIRDTLLSIGVQQEQFKYTPGMGVNLNVFQPLPYPPDPPYRLLTVGRVMREKGFPEILAAADILLREMPQLEWHICGAPEVGEEFWLDELNKRPNIVYHGQQSDMRSFYAMAHATTTTTTYHEGMSTICLESGACARPILGTRIHGVMETIDDGVTGFTINPHDVRNTVDVIKKFFALSNDSRAEMGLQAREKIVLNFDRNMMVDVYKRAIEEI